MDNINLKEDERIDDLEYKGLKLIQNKKGFCFGVDAVLLSDYAKGIKKGSTVVDIGTGTGIVAILLCAKTNLKKIYGIELQEEVANIAQRNVELNGLDDKMEVININIKDVFSKLEKNKIDVIVTNPPYKKHDTGVKNLDTRQLISRHEVECTLEDIIKNASLLLKDLGELYMVHRAERIVDIFVTLRKYKLEPKNIRFVHSKIGEKPNLVLVKAVKCAKEFLKIDKPLVIYGEDGNYTDEIYEIYDKKRK
ncbi:MAG: tRNA1(Val) (adenine(37)-N6)-methyltransferase [Clostridia bacterium]|nr:tRNA1(Val) (adenine(37)-N6)-methyltransferase [Clostridia bacterium]